MTEFNPKTATKAQLIERLEQERAYSLLLETTIQQQVDAKFTAEVEQEITKKVADIVFDNMQKALIGQNAKFNDEVEERVRQRLYEHELVNQLQGD